MENIFNNPTVLNIIFVHTADLKWGRMKARYISE